MECSADEEQHRIFLKFRVGSTSQYGRFVILDTDSWSLTLYSDRQVLGRLACNNSLYVISGSEVESYPVYSLDELRNWAEEKLNR